jgi:hypothetical protein
VGTNSVWAYHKGTAEASSPSEAWRNPGFNDSGWLRGRAPFFYDGDDVYYGNTELPDMINSYTSVSLRTGFDAGSGPAPATVRLRSFCDDGFVLWINGVLVAQVNKDPADLRFNAVADAAVSEPLAWREALLANPESWWRPGTNHVAVQAFNSSRSSSDFVFEMELRSVIPDTTPPTIIRVDPLPGVVGELTRITVEFSEPVTGVGFSDLRLNERPAVGIEGSGSLYHFTVEPPAYGEVRVTWDGGAGIEDQGQPPNRFDPAAPGASWVYRLVDHAAPRLTGLTPVPGTTLRSLDSVEVRFSEPVSGVEASDLRLNGRPAASVSGTEAGPYTFRFEPVAPGTVRMEWSADAHIRDLAEPPNDFAGEGWSYTIDPAFVPATVRISEILAGTSGASGLRDEDGELQDWIELENRGTTEVDLAGWSLSDDADNPGQWVFPSVRLAPGRFLVVFASGKDRRSAGGAGRLHTNFKLGAGGEFLGLFAPESPRVRVDGFEPSYPEQRNDYSYGRDTAGALRYFRTPTPGAANGTSTITGALPGVGFSVERGLFEAPFRLQLRCAVDGAVIRYTTDGSEPTPTTGTAYTGEIEIAGTRILRAAAFREGWLASPTATHTYVFPADVARQSAKPPGVPATWIDTTGRTWTADYEMDPEIVGSPTYRDRVIPALRSLPSMSIVTRPSDMFDNTTGIYPKSQARGPSWERPASVEILAHGVERSVQANGGVQMQGNSVRDPVKTGKHAFRVVFKGDYGASKLRHRVFPDSPLEEFDTLTLRADFNNSWMHWNGTQRPRGQRVRDAWMKESQRAMGGLASHSRFFHLYVNGLYWGLYDATERPDASFAAAYQGGAKDEYDVVNEGQLVDGNMTAYNTMRSLTALDTRAGYERMKQYLDVPAYIDYLLLHFYTGHEDWFTDKNWYASRRRVPGAGFRYQSWDGELMLNSPNANIVTRIDQPSGLHTRLLVSAEYRMEFADRVQRHCQGEGALTPVKVAARYEAWASRIELAMVAESARWGDYRRDVHPYSSGPYELYLPDVHFRAERQRLLTAYFPVRTSVLISQLQAAGLFPRTAVAPGFSLAPGRVPPGSRLGLSAPSGTIYFTTDGSDPRVAFTGQVSAGARAYTSDLEVQSTTVLKARSRVGTEWSALAEGRFEIGRLVPSLTISEIHYHPVGGEPYEFVEVRNAGEVPVDATGFRFTGIGFLFPVGSVLAPGQTVVIASGLAPATFAARHPGVPVFGWFDGSLADGGERITLLNREGHPVVSVAYDDTGGWPRAADGGGPSLELMDPWGDPDAPANWRASAVTEGSPGRFESSSGPGPIRLNEIRTGGDPGEPDWVELHNTGETAVDLGGWSLTDDSEPRKAVFPAGTVLPSRGYLLVACRGALDPNASLPDAAAVAGLPALVAGFGLEQRGETLSLFDAGGNRVDAATYGPQIPGYTLGRWGPEAAWTLGQPTPGKPNEAVPLTGERFAVINEWLANARPGEPDWVEVHNRDTSRPVSLAGLQFVVGGQVSRLGTAAFLAPGGFLVLEADGGGGVGQLGFKLPAGGGSIALHDASGQRFEIVEYSAQQEDVSAGRWPDGAGGPFQTFSRPTPGRGNGTVTLTPPKLDRVRWEAGALRFRVEGDAGAEYRIERSADLRQWTPVWTGHPVAMPFEGVVASEGGSVGFYRVQAGP